MTSPAITDVLLLTENVDDLPLPDPFYYLVGKKGLYIHKKTLVGRAIVPIAEAGHLPEIKGFLWMGLPLIPATLLGQVLSFFKAVDAKHDTEAMVYLTMKNGIYRVFVPRQKTSSASVDAKLNATHIESGWNIVGTIHSHPGMSAFHSGTDIGDAADHDGFHLTIGYVERTDPEYAAMISINGVNWKLEPKEYTTGEIIPAEHPAWWHRYIEPTSYSSSGITYGKWGGTSSQYSPSSPTDPATHEPVYARKEILDAFDELKKADHIENVDHYDILEAVVAIEDAQDFLHEAGIITRMYANRDSICTPASKITRLEPSTNHTTDEDYMSLHRLTDEQFNRLLGDDIEDISTTSGKGQLA